MSKSAASKRQADEAAIRLHQPLGDERNTAYWRVNGYPARVIVWTVAEWERLVERPTDAQFLPCGLWCVLRIDDHSPRPRLEATLRLGHPGGDDRRPR